MHERYPLLTDAKDQDIQRVLLEALTTRLALTTDQRPGATMAIDLDYLEYPDTLISALIIQCELCSN